MLAAAAFLCLASFAWGMVWHFLRVGKPTPTMALIAAAGLISASLQICALLRQTLWHENVSLAVYLVSLSLFWWSVASTRGKLAACGQGYITPQIVMHGPYRSIRHPFYTAYNLTWMAGFLASGWWPVAVSAVLMACLYHQSARKEEQQFLGSPMAVRYGEYMLRTGCYLPNVWIITRSIQHDRSGF